MFFFRAMSSVVDNLVTHPNVMNGAVLSSPQAGMQYVEGYALDEFCAGRFGKKRPICVSLMAAALAGGGNCCRSIMYPA